jgi:hypothetical protein
MHAIRDRFRNSERSIDSSPWPNTAENHDARFVLEKSTNEVVAHLPKLRQLLD